MMSNIPKLRFPEFSGEWEEKKIIQFCEISAGGDIDKNNSQKEFSSSYPYSVYSNSLENKGLYGYANYYKIDSDVVTVTGRGDVGHAVARHEKFVPIVRLLVCKPKNNENVDFLENAINKTKIFIESTGVPQLTAPQLGNVKLFLPSLAEQQKIADFLSNVDSIITAETKILNSLQKKKKALMQKLFSQQLRFKSDDGTDFPTWEEKKLGEISSSPKYGLNASGIDYDGEHKYLRITDIDEVTHTFSPEEITTPSEFSDDYLLEENDIVFARTGASTGKTYLYNPNDGDLYFAGFLIKFHIKDANARFVFYQTCTHEYEKWVHVMSTRSGQPGINSEEYSTLKIKLPCIEEQQKIANCLSSMDSLIQTQQNVVTTWQQRKKALLQQMFI